jgi:hypothetical protein
MAHVQAISNTSLHHPRPRESMWGVVRKMEDYVGNAHQVRDLLFRKIKR